MGATAARLVTVVFASLATATIVAGSPPRDDIDIPFQKFVLDNGLTLIVHEDTKAPIVAVNVWYHVGSKDEKPGRTGFAHLFEHLMFNGSEHFDDDYNKPLERVGATELNGTTDTDRTNYFQNVPKTALDTVLWLESDRMGHLLGVIDQATLDEQRGVVQNEKRQGENQPYGRVFTALAENSYPEGHPYSWSTIGSMDDLDAARLEDVQEWFRSSYGAANATLVIAGDVRADDVRDRVAAYFGDVPAGPPLTRRDEWIAKRTGTKRLTMQDRVPETRIYKSWNVPGWGTPEVDYLGLAADVLASGKTSRLYRRLVYEEQIATDVGAFVMARELGGAFMLQVNVARGAEPARVEREIDEELRSFLERGPAADALERAKSRQRARFVRGIERIGGFGGKSDILAQSQVFGGSPDAYRVSLERVAAATPQQVADTARTWLADGELILEVEPFPSYTTTTTPKVDRSTLPVPRDFPAGVFPRAEPRKLSNGLEVLVIERRAVPVVNLSLLLDAGYTSDRTSLAGAASLAMDMLDEGTSRRSALEISDELARLGAELSTAAQLDISTVSMSALAENLTASLDLFADVVLDPAFKADELERRKKQRIAAIRREKTQPITMALRVLPALLYGEEHAYGLPFTGSGTEASVAAITRDELLDYHRTWFKPGHATLIAVGATTADELVALLEPRLGVWKTGPLPAKEIATAAPKKRTTVFLIDKPGSVQSFILASSLVPPKANPDETAIQGMNDVLGGSFTARINMNLREGKHWSYGARTIIPDARGQRPFYVSAPVQTDKTSESMAEIERELDAIVGENPPTADELEKIKRRNILSLPGRWETSRAILQDLAEIVQFDLPEDYWNRLAARIEGLTLDQLRDAARTYLDPRRMVWLVVGDREKIEAGIRGLGLGEVVILDADGERVPADG
jgi:zinc protease